MHRSRVITHARGGLFGDRVTFELPMLLLSNSTELDLSEMASFICQVLCLGRKDICSSPQDKSHNRNLHFVSHLSVRQST